VFFCPASTFFAVPGEKRPQKPDFYSVSGKSGGTRDQPCHDRSFKHHNALPAAGLALAGLPGGGRWRDGGAHLRGARRRLQQPCIPAPPVPIFGLFPGRAPKKAPKTRFM
jgi:hypothetical protein